jgi:hypothetical protein
MNEITHSSENYTNIIAEAYQHYLGRSPQANELTFWLSSMQGGLSEERLDAAFLSSPEYISGHSGFGVSEWVSSLYQNELGRTPQLPEVIDWVRDLRTGISPSDVAYAFVSSIEHEAQRITSDYTQFLVRSPTPLELASWVSTFDGGGMTDQDIAASFLASPEYFAKNNSAADSFTSAQESLFGTQASPSSKPSWLADVAHTLTHSAEYYGGVVMTAYVHYLVRTPSDSEVNFWASATKNGLSEEQVESALIGSPEYLKMHGGQGAEWIKSLYQDVLGRTPSPVEVNHWVGVLNAGTSTADIAYAFAGSTEHEGLRIASYYTSFLGRTPTPLEVSSWVNSGLVAVAS